MYQVMESQSKQINSFVFHFFSGMMKPARIRKVFIPNRENCYICNKQFLKSSLEHHITVFHARIEIDLKCDFCCQAFRHKNGLRNHITQAHRMTPDRRKYHKCDLCEKIFIKKPGLTKHVLLVHENKRSHICNTCDKIFKSSGNLNAHISTAHEKKNIYQCNQCEKKISIKKFLGKASTLCA